MPAPSVPEALAIELPAEGTFKRLIWIAAACAALLKLICAATTLGTLDVATFFGFGESIMKHGLTALYRDEPLFNHMPMVGLGSALLYGITNADPRSFAFLFRVPSVAADLLTLATLLRIVPLFSTVSRWALLVFALSPVSFMVSGFHGNVDPIMTCLLTLAAFYCLKNNPVRCALFLALACNVKTPALLLTPVFFFFWLSRGCGWKFFKITCLITLAGWAYPLLVCPYEFLTHVLGYGSYWGIWGVTYWLWRTEWPPFSNLRFKGFSAEQSAVLATLKSLIILSTFWLAWVRRRIPGLGIFETIAGVWLILMVLAPGVAGQYLVWPAPFLVVTFSRSYGWITMASTLHLVVFYTVLCNGLPWFFGTGKVATNHIWMFSSNAPWIAFSIVLCWQAKALFAPRIELQEEV